MFTTLPRVASQHVIKRFKVTNIQCSTCKLKCSMFLPHISQRISLQVPFLTPKIQQELSVVLLYVVLVAFDRRYLQP